MNDKGSKFYYSRLSDGEKNLYNRICNALLNFEPAISIHCGMGKSFNLDIQKVLIAVLFDNPVFFYLDRKRVIVKQTSLYIQILFQYDYTKEETEALWCEIEKQIEEFINSQLRPEMSPLAKQLKIHHYVHSIHTSKEPYGKEDYSVVGALVKNSCVCEGFAKAYKLLCDRAGIASIVVVGDALLPSGQRIPHSWNITRINGVTSHSDSAWDSRYGGASYDYFNICDADISADHCFDTELYPKCEPNKINYFAKNDLIATDEEKLKDLVEANTGEPYFSVKLVFPYTAEQAATLPFERGTIRFNAMQNVIGYVKEQGNDENKS